MRNPRLPTAAGILGQLHHNLCGDRSRRCPPIQNRQRDASGTLTYDQVWGFDVKPANVAADRMTVVLKMSDGKFLSSQGSDGSYFVKDRKFTGIGSESPWQVRCPAH